MCRSAEGEPPTPAANVQQHPPRQRAAAGRPPGRRGRPYKRGSPSPAPELPGLFCSSPTSASSTCCEKLPPAPGGGGLTSRPAAQHSRQRQQGRSVGQDGAAGAGPTWRKRSKRHWQCRHHTGTVRRVGARTLGTRGPSSTWRRTVIGAQAPLRGLLLLGLAGLLHAAAPFGDPDADCVGGAAQGRRPLLQGGYSCGWRRGRLA